MRTNEQKLARREYFNIFKKALIETKNGLRKKKKGIAEFEWHHCLPRAKDLYPNWQSRKLYPNNQALLTYKEHYRAHELSIIIWYGSSMACSLWRMTHDKKDSTRFITAEDYEKQKINYIKYMQKFFKDYYSKPENIEKTSKRSLKMWQNIDDTIRLNRNKKISNKLMGNINGSYRINTKHTEKTKRIISIKKKLNALDPEYIKKISQPKKVFIYYFHENKYEELHSIKYSWKLAGFSSEPVFSRYVRYCNYFLINNSLSEMFFRNNCFASHINFKNEIVNLLKIYKEEVNNA